MRDGPPQYRKPTRRTWRAAETLAIALLLPGVGLACTRYGWRLAGVLPLLLLPSLVVLARMPPGQARAAFGLGAGRMTRLRLLWLPQLGPAVLLGLALAASVAFIGLAVRLH